MENDDVVILRIDTGEAVKSVGDLRYNISQYKQQLNNLEIGTKEYQETLEQLNANQNALRGAMNATTASMEEVTQAANGLGTSYNALVNQMAELKKQWRATSDEATRANLGLQIRQINDQLKELDASTGNFQRNVGDYANGVKKGLDAFTKGVGNAIPGLRSLNTVMDGFAKNPFVAILGLIVGLFARVINKMKETEEGQARLNKLMAAVGKILEPINVVIGWISDAVGDLIDWLSEALPKVTSWLGKVSAKLAGVGNAILQFLLAPLRSVIAVVKGVAKIIGDIFKGNWSKVKEDAKGIGTDIGDAWKKGFDVSANYETGKKAGEKVISGIASRMNRNKAKKAGKQLGSAVAEGVGESFQQQVDKALEEGFKKSMQRAKEYAQNMKEIADISKGIEEEITAEVDAISEAEGEAILNSFEQQKEAAENMKKAWSTSISSIASMLGSLADIYESYSDGSEKSEQRIKALRIASATIQTIQGAIGAYMQAVTTIAPPAGIIIGAANAATVTAAGLANIAKMRSTSLSGSSTPSVAPMSGVAASLPSRQVAAPAAVATLASDTRTLNAMGAQRVYILSSDIEASNTARKVQVAETTF